MTLLVDLDNTLADHHGQLWDDLREKHGIYLDPSLSAYDFDTDSHPDIKQAIVEITTQPGWWKNLPRLEGALEVISYAKYLNYDVHIVSKAPYNKPLAWTEKVEWCRAQQELRGIPINLVSDKSLFRGDVLYDDYEPYVASWLIKNPTGLGVIPKETSNSGTFLPGSDRMFTLRYEDVKSLLKDLKPLCVYR